MFQKSSLDDTRYEKHIIVKIPPGWGAKPLVAHSLLVNMFSLKDSAGAFFIFKFKALFGSKLRATKIKLSFAKKC